jgi:hypothetical protein
MGAFIGESYKFLISVCHHWILRSRVPNPEKIWSGLDVPLIGSIYFGSSNGFTENENSNCFHHTLTACSSYIRLFISKTFGSNCCHLRNIRIGVTGKTFTLFADAIFCVVLLFKLCNQLITKAILLS